MEVNQDTIQEFIRLLIESGGVHKVQPDHTVLNTVTGQPAKVTLAKTDHPIGVWYEGAPIGTDIEWLNPFKENLGRSQAREWFFYVLLYNIGESTKSIIRKIIADCVSKADDNYFEFDLMSKIRDKVDDKTNDEIEKIGFSQFIDVYYNRSKKFAEAQTALFSDELHESFSKIRKKTWEAIEIIFKTIFGSTDLEDYKYTAKTLNIPETEAKLSVIIAVLSALDPYLKDVLKRDIHAEELREHLACIEGYAKLYEFAVVSHSDKPTTQSPVVQSPIATGVQPMFIPGNTPIPVLPTIPTSQPQQVPQQPMMQAPQQPQQPTGITPLIGLSDSAPAVQPVQQRPVSQPVQQPVVVQQPNYVSVQPTPQPQYQMQAYGYVPTVYQQPPVQPMIPQYPPAYGYPQPAPMIGFSQPPMQPVAPGPFQPCTCGPIR